jgi:FlaA1/EpsC-like NDP-sugar epimerase
MSYELRKAGTSAGRGAGDRNTVGIEAEFHRGSTRARDALIGLSRTGKRVLLLANDFLLLAFATWLAYTVRFGRSYWPHDDTGHLLFWSAPVIGVVVFQSMGLYRLVTRYLGHRGAIRILWAIGLAVALWSTLVLMVLGSGVRDVTFPRSVPFLYGVLAFLFVWISREVAGFVLKGSSVRPTSRLERRRVVIYGAGESGYALAEALRRSGDYEPVGFIDDTESLIGQTVAGLKVYRVAKLAHFIESDGVREVLLALPERQRREQQAIIRRLAAHPVRVKTMPAMLDIASGRVSVTDLRSIDVDDLLGRDPVPPDTALLAQAITGKAVMITGAGGTIGAELTRQILRQSPRVLVLFEQSEVALYDVETEIGDTLAKMPEIDVAGVPKPVVVGVLGSVLDATLVERTIRAHRVETIFHAAAYKHVPIVEANPVVGLRNNTFGTAIVAEVAARTGVERVTLISTDKAVRPTNIMGASKRLAEMIFQSASAGDAGRGTIFTMVRFGNVLDSSGSVVRRFRKQIQDGGPVTVTHPDVIRYFMSIPEAAELVIQACAMAKGGEVFVLDMGEPVKIDDLARSMIRLMGLEVEDEENPDGDIPIRYIGLRPGEKLYEELLIDENTSPTEHPRIRRNHERHPTHAELRDALTSLMEAMESGHGEAIEAVLTRVVEDYTPTTEAARRASQGEIWAPASRTLH